MGEGKVLGMRNIRDMGILLIDITNACNYSCSNCTRFCGHFEKPYFMTPEYFEKAVISLRNWPKVIGVMGGEPTLHPQFAEICEIFKKNISQKSNRGLWSNGSTPQFIKHKTIIDDTFGYFNINTHVNGSVKHTPILTAIDDFEDMGEQQKENIIDKCWVQNYWSATITPKGAYFCEVCATMSNLFHGPDGWGLDEEWWKKDLPEYKEQIKWACGKCGCAIPLRPRISIDGTDDVSSSNLKRLKEVNSPKIAKGKYQLFNCELDKLDPTQIRNCAWYW